MIRTINVFVALILGAAITFSLFYLMQSLIAAGVGEPIAGNAIRIADISIPDLEIEVTRTEPKPEEPDVPEEVPDLPDLEVTSMDMTGDTALNVARVEVDLGNIDANVSVGVNDTDMLPIVTVNPQYPNRALSRGIEGWCQVIFTVTENGTVENPSVVDSDPPEIFDSASLRAVLRFKFNPRVVNGVAVPVEGVQYLFTYKVDQ